MKCRNTICLYIPADEFSDGGDDCDKEVHDDELVELSSDVSLPALTTEDRDTGNS